MIVRITSGIPGFDELTSPMNDQSPGLGGIPENTVTLIYGPEGVGKSLFCSEFAYNGLSHDEPCLYLTTDLGIEDIYENMLDMGIKIDGYLENEMLHIIDASGSGTEFENSNIYQSSNVKNPTDILVKVTRGLNFITEKNPRSRGVIDSVTTILESNDEMLIMRVLKTYILRVKEAGGTAVITHMEGASDPHIEVLIKSMVDNIVKLDGETIIIEAMKGIGKKEAPYHISKEGITVGKGRSI